MIVQSEYLKSFLPFGEGLKALINDSSLTESNLDKLLRNRGVFIHNRDKNSPIELLSTSLLSPKEFDFLREKQNYREDKPKRSTLTIPINSEKDLIEILPNIDFNKLITSEFRNYEVCSSPTYEMIGNNPNKVKIEIPLEILDSSKNWATSKSIYKTVILFEKNLDKTKLLIKTNSTATETKEYSGLYTKAIVKDLKQNGYTSQESKLEMITFDSFRKNEDRILFFLRLIDTNNSNFVYFQDVLKIGLIPATDKELPEQIEWMSTTKNVMLDGDKLHEIFFIDNKEFSTHLIFYKMLINYKFEYHAAKGNCNALFEFPRFLQTTDPKTEFEIKISNIDLDLNYKHINKDNVEEWLLEQLTNIQLKAFRRYTNDSE